MPEQNAKSIFLNALEMTPGGERRQFVLQCCGRDQQLQGEVEQLLAYHNEVGSFLEGDANGLQRTSADLVELCGSQIGPYKLLESIGEGGMGVVYMADQSEPVRRRVALKIIKPGMDSKQVIARFEAERQALALMDHPNIAKVYDAGTTESERPYFVMELVRGIPITDFCDQNRLSSRERLRLFQDVCHAVQHAHQKGIIHRDVKPGNVLVTLHDGNPVVKVIDFGVAKAINQQLTERTLYTRFSQMVGTPMYMSPEQAEMSGLDVDTRTDIYSLGVLLYELLTGETPFDRQRLGEAAYDEMRRIIREEDPPKPSNRVSTLGKSASSISLHRGTDPKHLTQQLRGDLDWIVMKALDKDRSRRYETANGFAVDIRRYLNDEPVFATPPSPGYRLNKFVLRNRVACAAGGTVAAALLVGLALALAGFVQANQARDRIAAEAAETRAIAGFFKEMFESVNPIAGGIGPAPMAEMSVQDLLDGAEPKIAESFKENPRLEAEVRFTFASTYGALGNFSEAARQAKRAMDLRTRELGDAARPTLASAEQYAYASRGQTAVDVLRPALKRGEEAYGPDDPLVISLKTTLGYFLWHQRDLESAEPLARDAFARAPRALGDQHPSTLTAQTLLGAVLVVRGSLDEAEPLLREVLESASGNLNPDTPKARFPQLLLTQLLQMSGRYDEAEAQFNEMLLGYERAFGKQHPWYEHVRAIYGSILQGRGDFKGALALLDEVVALEEDQLGPHHPVTNFTRLERIQLLIDNGKLELAEQEARFLALPTTKIMGDPLKHGIRASFGWTLLEQGRLHEAEPIIKEALETHNSLVGGGDFDTPWMQWLYGRALTESERYDEAEPLLLAAYARESQIRGSNHWKVRRCAGSVADLYERWSRPEEAMKWRRLSQTN